MVLELLVKTGIDPGGGRLGCRGTAPSGTLLSAAGGRPPWIAALLIAVPMAFLGCVGPVGRDAWMRPNTDRQQVARDEYECDREARLRYGAGAYDRSRGAPGQEVYELCMKQKGYVPVP